MLCLAGALHLACFAPVPQSRVWAADQPVPAAQQEPLGRTVTVATTITAQELARISRIALGLQSQAKEKQQPAILILELADGPSRFGDVRELALFLTELNGVRTVAYVPADIRGTNVIVALACQEIVMAPRAMLGDIGRGKPIEEDVRTFVETLAAKRHNPLISLPLVQGMMDPAVELLSVRRKTGEGAAAATETEIMTQAQFERLINAKVVIDDQRTIKAPNSPGLFVGARAREGNFLCSNLAEERIDLLKIYRLPREALREDPHAGADVVARRIKIEGEINPLTQEFIQRQIDRALGQGANLLIFEIDSPGGYLKPSEHVSTYIAYLDPKQVRTVAYVPKMAMSGAAIIALGCDEIYLLHDAQIGDAGPIEMREGGQFERVEEKFLSPLREFLKNQAVQKQRPPAVAMAMADRNLNVFKVTNKQTGDESFMTEAEIHESAEEWVKGPRIDDAGNGVLLTVGGKRAHELKIAEEPVGSFEELKQRLGVAAEESLPAVQPTWVDTMVFVLNSPFVTGLLFMLGILLIYAEMHAPSGLFLIGAVVCFALFFWSRVLGGTADWLEVILFLLGAACIAVELFVIPGTGIFIVSGGILILFSLVMASQTFFLPTSNADYKQLATELQTLGGSIFGVVVAATVLSRFLPRMKFFDKFVLVPPGATGPANSSGPQLRPDLLAGGEDAEPFASLLQQRGRALTILRPSGKARIGDKVVDVVSEGPFIEADQAIQVIQVNGNRIVVRELG